MRQVYPILNKEKFKGMPMKTKYGFGYLLEYRADNPCKYVVKLTNGVTAILREDQIIQAEDEDISHLMVSFARDKESRRSTFRRKSSVKDEDKRCSMF
mmetsp:Transcript_23239/g.22813  ORF Transcript_23239/g.22813 Transcript_23239/m.22813 type:complete len:98 (-) Transcript_23239:42-335(-)